MRIITGQNGDDRVALIPLPTRSGRNELSDANGSDFGGWLLHLRVYAKQETDKNLNEVEKHRKAKVKHTREVSGVFRG
ncbi:hypothetical protein LshimejAT787_1700500 [Lyophyllum shimeji]|uniref:Uncharacterized protein n=1 Tax=Lyophyllum shimeji TaxID=47721 RepID=A0A9P3UTA4_LYOSH|nr:hypothetical protein LshimejAT787_1700500 [Lyophyllum shimeji]